MLPAGHERKQDGEGSTGLRASRSRGRTIPGSSTGGRRSAPGAVHRGSTAVEQGREVGSACRVAQQPSCDAKKKGGDGTMGGKVGDLATL